VNYTPIVPAELGFAGTTPYSARYDDIYHSAQGGLEQARHVFLGGNELLGEDAAWQGRERFVILETGFGLGLNFLATWQAWKNSASSRRNSSPPGRCWCPACTACTSRTRPSR